MKDFVGRFDELNILEEYFKNELNQIVYIHGRSGCGKTTLAHEFAAKISKQPKCLARTFNAKYKLDIYIGFKNIAAEVKEKNETLEGLFDHNYSKIKRMLNKYLISNKVKLFTGENIPLFKI